MPATFFTPGAVELFIGIRHPGHYDQPSAPPYEPGYPPTPDTTGGGDFGEGGDFDPPGDYGEGGDFDIPNPYPDLPYYPGQYPYPSQPPTSGSGGTGIPPGSGGGDWGGFAAASLGFAGNPVGSQLPPEPPTRSLAAGVSPTYSAVGDAGSAAAMLTNARWYYLGSAVVAPEVEAEFVHTPFVADYNAPDAFQVVFNSERHRVTGTLNRVNWRTYGRLRNQLIGAGSDIVRAFAGGSLVLASHDVMLYVRRALPNISAAFIPDAQSRGRIYYSAMLTDYHETTANGRVHEATVLFDCRPLFFADAQMFWLYTERDVDLPFLIPE